MQAIAAARTASRTSSCSARSRSTAAARPRRASRRTTRPTTRCRRSSTSRSRTRRAGSRRKGTRRTTRSRRSSPTTTGTPTPTRTSTSCRPSSATTTWAGSATSSRPTTPEPRDAELLARDRLAHELMYFSRGNPVVYYGDEQGFTGAGGDQDARQTMFASQVPEYLDDDLLGTDRPTPQDNFVTDAPAVPEHQPAGRRHRGTPGAARRRRSRCATPPTGPGVYAFSRIDRTAADASTSSRSTTASRPQSAARADLHPQGHLPQGVRRRTALSSTTGEPRRPCRSRVRRRCRPSVYESDRPHPAVAATLRRSAWPRRRRPIESRGRMHVTADVERRLVLRGHLPAQARPRRAGRPSAPTTPRRTRSSTTSRRSARHQGVLPRGRAGQRRPHQRHRCPRGHGARTANHDRGAARGAQRARRRRGARGRRPRTGDPRRCASSAAWPAARGRRSAPTRSSPVYTVFDDLTPLALAAGTAVQYRAILAEPDGTTVTSAVRSVRFAGPPATMARLHYFRPAGDYDRLGPAHVG